MTNPLSHLGLGKATEYPSQYDASLLQAVPRQLNRDELNITADTLPFNGFDEWTLFELSWLLPSGKPQVGIALVNVPADSPNLIESKSFKLYLNSLNQHVFADIDELTATLVQDLSACAGSSVSVSVDNELRSPALGLIPGESIDDEVLSHVQYQLEPELLADAIDEEHIVDETLHSRLLKSNCLITNQPDWGCVAIHYQGPQIDRAKLLQYLISFRQHNEFHEQCVERIFCDLLKYAKCQHLTVQARYTRRGGLDINPLRSNENLQWPRWRTARQ